MNKPVNNNQEQQRVAIHITGAVQGVGFRPFIFRLAQDLGLTGFVINTSSGVEIEAEGTPVKIKSFINRIPVERPQHSFIQSYQYAFLDPKGFDGFQIKESDTTSSKQAVVLPDIATCPECLREIFDPKDRRYLYPFTNCTHCGPRYSIIEALPYDRRNTSMNTFEMCTECFKEYTNPEDRRFHAQPNACSKCGPHLELWDQKGEIVLSHHEALLGAVNALKEGKIVAVKGIGGFHLFVDAYNERSVERLRSRKHREEKPFAMIFPSMESIYEQCDVSKQEQMLLQSAECPIVLLQKKKNVDAALSVAPSVAPGNPCLGVMLPYSPLHHILMEKFGRAVVATSANLSEEPICTDEGEALRRLAEIADLFLVHDRPIVRSIDDSVVRIMADRPLVLRRARGYAPLPIAIREGNTRILSTGGHLKNTIALNIDKNVFVSQHIGDLQTQQSLVAFRKTWESLKSLYESSPGNIVCDLHPDYLSTKFAEESGLFLTKVQHHHAHIVSCMAENRLEGMVLGITWDGTGFGLDETIWGGEFLKASLTDYERVAHFKTFLLPGGDKAVIEPRRAAAAVLYEMADGDFMKYADLATIEAFSQNELKIAKDMLDKSINTPATSSVGRLFDAVASLLDVKQIMRFEGQAAMCLEYIAGDVATDDIYNFAVLEEGEHVHVLDWRAMFQEIIDDIRNGVDKSIISAKFHNTLVEMAVNIAQKINEQRIVLSGGCFQNKYLTERMIRRLREEGFKVYWHQLVPPNDGGISLGQAVCGAQRLALKEKSAEIAG